MSPYWDPTASLALALANPPADHTAPWTTLGRNVQREIFKGSWVKNDWCNVPGPFYATNTDTCGGGRALAPNLILVNEDWTEFVFRQPVTATQVLQLLDAAYDDPYGAYGCDGDHHWNLDEIRVWWGERRRLLEWIDVTRSLMADQGAGAEIASLSQYAADIQGPLEGQLRTYAHWLENRQGAHTSGPPPALWPPSAPMHPVNRHSSAGTCVVPPAGRRSLTGAAETGMIVA